MTTAQLNPSTSGALPVDRVPERRRQAQRGAGSARAGVPRRMCRNRGPRHPARQFLWRTIRPLLEAACGSRPPTWTSTWDELVTTPGPGAGANVKVFAGDGSVLASYYALRPHPDRRRPVAATTGQVIVGAGAGGQGLVRVLDGLTGTENQRVTPFVGFNGAVRVTTINRDGDTAPDLVASAGPSAAPEVKIPAGARPGVRDDFLSLTHRSSSAGSS